MEGKSALLTLEILPGLCTGYAATAYVQGGKSDYTGNT